MDGNRGESPLETEVSVIMAVHNGEATVAAAIASVQAQTFPDWELLVVDDCSTDGSTKIVHELAARDRRIRLFLTEANSGGPAAPRNLGLKHARGKVICLLDQDDLWRPDKLEAQAAKFREGSFGLVYSDALVVRNGDSDERYSHLWGPMPEGQVADELVAGCFVPALTAAVPRSVVETTGLFDEQLSGVDDYDYWLRIALAGHAFGYVDAPLATWVVGTNSLSHRRAQQLERLVSCLTTHAERYPAQRQRVAGRVADANAQLWPLRLDTYVHEGGWRALVRAADSNARRLDALRAAILRIKLLLRRTARAMRNSGTHSERNRQL